MATGGWPSPPPYSPPVSSPTDCPQCGSLCLGPTVLVCGHLSCRRCLHDMLEPLGPPATCRKCGHHLHFTREQGLSFSQLVQQLGIDPVMGEMVQHQLKMKTDVKCLNCMDTQATNVCQDCHEDFCDTCSSNHQRSRIGKNHVLQLLPRTLGNSATATPAAETPSLVGDCQSAEVPGGQDWKDWVLEEVALLQLTSSEQPRILHDVITLGLDMLDRMSKHKQMLDRYCHQLPQFNVIQQLDRNAFVVGVNGGDVRFDVNTTSLKKRLSQLRNDHCIDVNVVETMIQQLFGLLRIAGLVQGEQSAEPSLRSSLTLSSTSTSLPRSPESTSTITPTPSSVLLPPPPTPTTSFIPTSRPISSTTAPTSIPTSTQLSSTATTTSIPTSTHLSSTTTTTSIPTSTHLSSTATTTSIPTSIHLSSTTTTTSIPTSTQFSSTATTTSIPTSIHLSSTTTTHTSPSPLVPLPTATPILLPSVDMEKIEPRRTFHTSPEAAEDGNTPYITAMICLPDGRIAMTDWHNSKVKVMEASAPHTVTASLHVDEGPRRLALLNDGQVAVTTSAPVIYLLLVTNTVNVASRVQTDRTYWGITGLGEDQLLVSHVKSFTGPATLDVVTRKGNLVKSLTDSDMMPGLKSPWYLCDADNQHVLVSDCNAHCIYKIDTSSGQVTSTLQHTDMKCPQQVCVDSAGLLYVASGVGRCVFLMDSAGHCRKLLTDRQHSNPGFEYPVGICLTQSGHLAVLWGKRGSDSLIIYYSLA